MGIKFPGTSPSLNRSPIHLESLVSSLFPLTAFIVLLYRDDALFHVSRNEFVMCEER